MGMIHYNRQRTKERLMRGEVPKWVANSPRAEYITKIVLSIPPWVDQKELLALNARAAAMTRLTGVLHHLDHIVPVTHPRVCGLTVPWNLCIAPYKFNLAKSNYWNPDQLDLFEDIPSQEDALAIYLESYEQLDCEYQLTSAESFDTILIP